MIKQDNIAQYPSPVIRRRINLRMMNCLCPRFYTHEMMKRDMLNSAKHDAIFLCNTLCVFHLYKNAKISMQSPYLNIEMTQICGLCKT